MSATEVKLSPEQLTSVYFELVEDMKKAGLSGDYKQWIADSYHCSECWGQKMTYEEMLLELAESRRQADPDDYVPDIMLYKECAEYWNELCDRYPQ